MLSAIEGLKLDAPQMGRAVVPLTVVILAILFIIQRNGTSWIGGIFGPVMLVWFIIAGVLGVLGIVRSPAVLAALSPVPAATYLWSAGPLAFVVVGAAFLAVTGGEAFYADMGHFGPLPIRVAWFGVALPALTLNYFGQGGLMLAEPHSQDVIDSPFYALAPHWAHYPLILLATVATVIAAQAIISGAYSLTRQAINLGFLPRMNVVHTEGREIGQIYVPFVNWALAAGTIAAVIGFGSSDALAGAYRRRGVAADGDHDADGDLRGAALEAQPVPRLRGQWQPHRARCAVLRLDLDQAPRGRLVPLAHRLGDLLPDADLAEGRGGHGRLAARDPRAIADVRRAPARQSADAHAGTAIVLGRMAKGVPLALSHNVNCNRTLHENVVLVAVVVTETPLAPDGEQISSPPSPKGSRGPNCASASWSSRMCPKAWRRPWRAGRSPNSISAG